jgi:hypothetical protein
MTLRRYRTHDVFRVKACFSGSGSKRLAEINGLALESLLESGSIGLNNYKWV